MRPSLGVCDYPCMSMNIPLQGVYAYHCAHTNYVWSPHTLASYLVITVPTLALYEQHCNLWLYMNTAVTLLAVYESVYDHWLCMFVKCLWAGLCMLVWCIWVVVCDTFRLVTIQRATTGIPRPHWWTGHYNCQCIWVCTPGNWSKSVKTKKRFGKRVNWEVHQSYFSYGIALRQIKLNASNTKVLYRVVV